MKTTRVSRNDDASRTYPLPVRIVGVALAVAGMLGGAALLGLAAYQHFAIVSNFHPSYQVAQVWDSAGDDPLVIATAGEYGITSLRGPLEGCQLTSADGVTITALRDETIRTRPAFRFTSPARTYTRVDCPPGDHLVQVFRGEDLRTAAVGWDGAIHPSLAYLAAGVAAWVVGMFFWSRFVTKPRDWNR